MGQNLYKIVPARDMQQLSHCRRIRNVIQPSGWHHLSSFYCQDAAFLISHYSTFVSNADSETAIFSAKKRLLGPNLACN